MNRRKLLLSVGAAPLVFLLPDSNAWSDYTPCGQLVQFSTEDAVLWGAKTRMLVAKMRRRGIEYALQTGVDGGAAERLMRSLSVTTYWVDVRDGVMDEGYEGFDRYLGDRK